MLFRLARAYPELNIAFPPADRSFRDEHRSGEFSFPDQAPARCSDKAGSLADFRVAQNSIWTFSPTLAVFWTGLLHGTASVVLAVQPTPGRFGLWMTRRRSTSARGP